MRERDQQELFNTNAVVGHQAEAVDRKLHNPPKHHERENCTANKIF
jgi:hypothetical protein